MVAVWPSLQSSRWHAGYLLLIPFREECAPRRYLPLGFGCAAPWRSFVIEDVACWPTFMSRGPSFTLSFFIMSRVVSERWKRRVGQFHYALEEDEFYRYSPDNTEVEDCGNKLVIETPVKQNESFDKSMNTSLACGMIVVTVTVLLVVLRRQRHKIPRCAPVNVSRWLKHHTETSKRGTLRKGGRRRDATATAAEERKKCSEIDVFVTAKRELHRAVSVTTEEKWKVDSETHLEMRQQSDVIRPDPNGHFAARRSSG